MAKGIYVGIGGVPYRAKPYISVGGVPRKVKKAYVGVGGVPRLVFSEGIKYGGELDPLLGSGSTPSPSGDTNDTYAIFGCASTVSNSITAYSPSLVRTNPNLGLTNGRALAGATRIQDKVLFAGGENASGKYLSDVQGYDRALVRTSLSYMPNGVYAPLAASNSLSAIFASGYKNATTNAVTTDVSGYNANLTKNLSSNCPAKWPTASTSFADHALFFFEYADNIDECIAYNSSNVKLNFGPVGIPNRGIQNAISLNNEYLLVGIVSNPISGAIDVYNTSFTKVSQISLSDTRMYPTWSRFNEYSLAIGGRIGGSNWQKTVDYYDSYLIRDTFLMPTERYGMKCVQIGNSLILAGGDYRSTVEYLTQ